MRSAWRATDRCRTVTPPGVPCVTGDAVTRNVAELGGEVLGFEARGDDTSRGLRVFDISNQYRPEEVGALLRGRSPVSLERVVSRSRGPGTD